LLAGREFGPLGFGGSYGVLLGCRCVRGRFVVRRFETEVRV
jgi:hypothetical protein